MVVHNPIPLQNRPLTYLFDGTTSTVVSAPDTGAETNLIRLAVDISVTSKLELYAGLANYLSGPYVLLKDNVEQGRFTPIGQMSTDWYEVPNMAGKTFNEIQVTRVLGSLGTNYTGSGLGGIKRDDKLLVDALSPVPTTPSSKPGSSGHAPPLVMPSTASPSWNSNAPVTSPPSLNSAPKWSLPWHVSGPSKPMRSMTMPLTPSFWLQSLT